MTQYPARIAKAEGGYVVTFRDIPEAITQGFTKEEALAQANDALATAMDFYFELNRKVPAPTEKKKGEFYVQLPASVAVKVLLLNEMVAQSVSRSELATRMGTTPQTVSRIVNLDHTTKLDTLSEALNAVGKRLEFSVQAA